MFDINTPVTDSESDGEIDYDRLSDYIDDLVAEFDESPEAKFYKECFKTEIAWAAVYMRAAADYCGVTPATMTSWDSEEVLFDIFPRKVTAEPFAALEIIGEINAFWKYLSRTRNLGQSEAILKTLTPDDGIHLQEAMEDPSNFGMAKSFFMAGEKAGFDLSDPDEMEIFTAQYNAALNSQPMPMVATDKADDIGEQPAASPLFSDTTIRHDSAHVGRNEPCPCGSGRKFKKCCRR